MKLSRLGEFGLIERVRRATPKGRGVLLGIGDDAAWVRTQFASCLITSDLLIEDVHFNLKWTPLFALGYKTLAVNLSDIAAMGGLPAYLILSLGIPAKFRSEDIDEFYRGVRSLAAQTGVVLVGGDTNRAASLLISACLLGHAPYPPVRRAGAKIGDDIYVTGTVGDAALALKWLRRNSSRPKRGAVGYLLARHHRPIPRVRAGALLARARLATAMIDISDGLLQDLGHLCKASGVGATLWQAALPLSPAYRKLCGEDGAALALTGGEDYELLFCARPRHRARIQQLARRAEVSMTLIGRCIGAHRGIAVLDSAGRRLAIAVQGHDHFKKD